MQTADAMIADLDSLKTGILELIDRTDAVENSPRPPTEHADSRPGNALRRALSAIEECRGCYSQATGQTAQP